MHFLHLIHMFDTSQQSHHFQFHLLLPNIPLWPCSCQAPSWAQTHMCWAARAAGWEAAETVPKGFWNVSFLHVSPPASGLCRAMAETLTLSP